MSLVNVERVEVEEMPSPERRRFDREQFVVRVAYATVDDLFSDFTRDINEGGLFIPSDRPKPPGTEVSMRFTLPGSERIVETSGRVVRVSDGEGTEPPGMGIEFDPLSPETSSGVDQLIRSMRTGMADASTHRS